MIKTLFNALVMKTNRWYDVQREPKRFLIFFIPLSTVIIAQGLFENIWTMIFMWGFLLGALMWRLLYGMAGHIQIIKKTTDTIKQETNRFENLSFEDKESLVRVLFDVQTGHVSCRRMATELIALHKKE